MKFCRPYNQGIVLHTPSPQPAVPASYAQESDHTLALRARDGDAAAFGELARRHAPRLLSVCMRVTRVHSDAEDAVQDAMLRFWRNPLLWNPDKGAAFSTWLYRVAVNAALDKIRKTSRIDGSELREDASIAPPGDCPEAGAFAREDDYRAAWMRHAIDSLPERQFTALNLCFYEEMSNKQAADVMDISVKALESLLIRGKNTLREKAAALHRNRKHR